MIRQKVVRFSKSDLGHKDGMWLLGESASDSYLASQCKGNSGLEKDLSKGWLVMNVWEDKYQIVFLLQHKGLQF